MTTHAPVTCTRPQHLMHPGYLEAAYRMLA